MKNTKKRKTVTDNENREKKAKQDAARQRLKDKKNAWHKEALEKGTGSLPSSMQPVTVVQGTVTVIDQNRPLQSGEVAETITHGALYSRQPVTVVKGTATVIDQNRPLQSGEVAETITRNALRLRQPVTVVKGTATVIDQNRPLQSGEVAETITRATLEKRNYSHTESYRKRSSFISSPHKETDVPMTPISEAANIILNFKK